MPKPSPHNVIERASARLAEIATELDTIAKYVTEALTAMENAPPNDMAIAYWQITEPYESLDTMRKMVYGQQDRLNKTLLPMSLKRADMDLIRIPGIGRSFYIVPKQSASILEGKKEEAFEWLRAHDNGAIIQPTVNAQTLTTALRELEVNKGISAPEELFNFRSYDTTGSRKYNPKTEPKK